MGVGNKPLGAGLGCSSQPSITSKLTHSSFRDTQTKGGLPHCDVGDIIVWGFRRELELDGAGMLECAHFVYEEAYYFAVVVQPLENALVVGGGAK